MAQDCTISSFLSKFPGGFARNNRYLVELQLPPGINGNGDYLNSESTTGTIESLGQELNRQGAVQFACNTCTMPARTLMTYDHSQHAAPMKIPFSQQYDLVTFTFYNNKELNQRRFFDIWQTAVININDNSLNFYVEYAQDVRIWQLDRRGEITYGVTLYGAYPVTIGDVQYESSGMDSTTITSVTLAFKLWKAEHDQTRIVIV